VTLWCKNLLKESTDSWVVKFLKNSDCVAVLKNWYSGSFTLVLTLLQTFWFLSENINNLSHCDAKIFQKCQQTVKLSIFLKILTVYLYIKTGRLGLFWLFWDFYKHVNFCLRVYAVWNIVMKKLSENVNRQLSCQFFEFF